jgi:hypothetical protein
MIERAKAKRVITEIIRLAGGKFTGQEWGSGLLFSVLASYLPSLTGEFSSQNRKQKT